MPVWSHLPNAAHIDALLADVKARPKVWDASWYVVRDTIYADDGDAAENASWRAVRSTVRGAERDALLDAAWRTILDTIHDTARGTAWRAISALITWDESAALLDLTPDALRTIISTCDGAVKYQAVLLLPAVIVRSNT